MNVFNPVLGTELSIQITSAPVTLAGIGLGVAAIVDSANAILLKNGVPLGTGTLSDGDVLVIQVTSANQFACPTHVVFTIGTQKYVFTTVTKNDPNIYVYPGFSAITPFDATKYPSGQDYIPSSAANTLFEYDAAGTLLSTVPDTAPVTNTVTANNTHAVADYQSNTVKFIDSVTKAIVSSVVVGLHPAGVTRTAPTSLYPKGLTWVAISGENKIVAVYDNAVVASIAVGVRPMGICSSSDGSQMFVTNNGDNTVTHLKFANNAWASTVVPVGKQPFEVVVDASGTAWCSCIGSDAIFAITDLDVVSSVTVTGGVRGLAVDASNSIWVACANSSTVTKIAAGTQALSSFPTALSPLDISVGLDGSLYVTSFGESCVEHFSQTGALISRFSVQNFPYGISVSEDGHVWVASLYQNSPSFTYTHTQTALGFGIVSPAAVRPNTLVQSNSVTVSGIDAAVTASVPNIFGAVLTKNGVAVGQSTTVVSGDVLAFSFTTPMLWNVNIEVPLYIGNTGASFVSQIPAEVLTPTQFTFTDVLNASLSTPYTSNSITVSGIDVLAVLTMNVVGGTIVKNGVDLQSNTAQVVLNDVVAVKAISAAQHSTIDYINVSIGTVSAVWAITTAQATQYQYIVSKNVGPYDPSLTSMMSSVGNLIRISLSDYSQARWTFVPGPNPNPSIADSYLPMLLESGLLQFTSGTATVVPRFVSCSGPNSVLDTLNNTMLSLSAAPRELTEVGTRLYVALVSGRVAVFDALPNNTYVLTAEIAVGTSLYSMTSDASGNVWTVDLSTDTLYKITGLNVVQTIPNAGGDIWSMAASLTHLWTANSYDNTVSKINLATGAIEQIIPVLSVPSLVTLDSSGNVWVAHYGTNTLLQLSPTDGSVIKTVTLPDSSAAFMFAEPGYLWVIENSYALSTIQSNLAVLPAPVISFLPQLAAPINTTIRSNVATVSGLLRPTGISTGLSAHVRMYVNGTLVVSGSTTIVNNGDTVQLEVDCPATYLTDLYVAVHDFQSSNVFHVLTQGDPVPTAITFLPQFDAYVGWIYKTENATIAGMSAGTTALISVDDTRWSVTVNGVQSTAGASVSVMNGDVVSMSGPTKGIYGQRIQYSLQYRANANSAPTTFGMLFITNKTLVGAIAPAVYDLVLAPATNWIDLTLAQQNNAPTISGIVVGRRDITAALPRPSYGVDAVQLVATAAPFDISSAPYRDVSAPKFVDLTGMSVASAQTTFTSMTYSDLRSAAPAYTRNIDNAPQLAAPTGDRNVVHATLLASAVFEHGVASASMVVAPVYSKQEFGTSPTVMPQYSKVIGSQITVAPQFEKQQPYAPYTVVPSYEKTVADSIVLQNPKYVVNVPNYVLGLALPYVKTVQQMTISPPEAMTISVGEIISISGMSPIKTDATYASVTAKYIRSESSFVSVPALTSLSYTDVQQYTIIEPAAVEGAYATASLAVAAGAAAGYPDAYPVALDHGYFIWAAPHPIQSSGCGQPPKPNTFPVPDKWYVHGG